MPPGRKKPLTPAQQESILRRVTQKQKRELAAAADKLGASAFKPVQMEVSEPADLASPSGSQQERAQQSAAESPQQQQQFQSTPFDVSKLSADEKLDHIARLLEDLPNRIADEFGVS